MSELEQSSIPILGALLQDISTPLDFAQQKTLSLWMTKTAMILEAVKKPANRFFTQTERVPLRTRSIIPSRTTSWLGRYSGNSLGAYGTDLSIELPNAPHAAIGYATTVIVGHVVLQLLGLHLLSKTSNEVEAQPRPGPWEETLFRIWPTQN